MAKISRAQAQAGALRRKHGVTSAPVDVVRLARMEGLAVERADFGDEISGLLLKHGRHATIGVNARHTIARQRFTVAHELGHFILHGNRDLFVDQGYVVHFRDEKSSAGYDPVEIEANQFAAELIMPQSEVRRLFNQHKFDIDDEGAMRRLAARFEVSPTAMAVRLASLGLVLAS